MRRQELGLGRTGRAFRRRDLRDCCELAVPDFGLVEAPLQDWGLLWWIGVERHLSDAQTVVLKDFEAPLFLHGVMFAFGAPADHRFLIAPGGMRQHPSR